MGPTNIQLFLKFLDFGLKVRPILFRRRRACHSLLSNGSFGFRPELFLLSLGSRYRRLGNQVPDDQ